MREIGKAEKEARRKGKNKKSKKKPDIGEVQDGFQVDSQDPRFKALFESHEFAIDPTNPKFKSTRGMKTLLEEGRKKRKVDDLDGDDTRRSNEGYLKNKSVSGDLDGLVKRLKGKSKVQRV
jgi:hypothetical protein